MKNLSSLSNIPLPVEWQRKVMDALGQASDETRNSDSIIEVSSGEEEPFGPLGFGSSQESRFSVHGEGSSSEIEENVTN